MSNRSRVDIYSRAADDRQALSNPKRRKKLYGKGHASNIQRLADIEKTIKGRRGGQRAATVLPWAIKYFRIALPHIMASRSRVKAAGNDPIEAVQMWALDQVGLLVITYGQDWIAEQARANLAKSRRFPRIDRTNNTIDLQEGERAAYGICSLSEKDRPKKVRDAEDQERRRQAEQDRRAQDPNHTPRSESKAAQIRAAGGNVDTEKSRKRRARLAAEKAAAEADPYAGLDEFSPEWFAAFNRLEGITETPANDDLSPSEVAMHPVSCPDLDGAHPVSCPTCAEAVCTLFRALHLDTTQDTISAPSRDAQITAIMAHLPETFEDVAVIDHEMGPDDDAWWAVQILKAQVSKPAQLLLTAA